MCLEPYALRSEQQLLQTRSTHQQVPYLMSTILITDALPIRCKATIESPCKKRQKQLLHVPILQLAGKGTE